ncbi:MAG: 16S rRNA (guanine(966)-N(2))-methyltransferase RsmD [Pseudomonadota bacterium]
MRIIAGRHKGLQLASPNHSGLRPTSDRLRETIFNILTHSHPGVLEGARVLDLFAGTGALGLEALSRGARSALFVDQDANARALIRRNLEAAGVMGLARISKRDAIHLGPAGAQGGFTLVFLDPPYGKGLARRALIGLLKGGWLADHALIVIEETASADLGAMPSYDVLDRRTAGDSQIVLLTQNTDRGVA